MQFLNCTAGLTLIRDWKGLANLVKHFLLNMQEFFIALASNFIDLKLQTKFLVVPLHNFHAWTQSLLNCRISNVVKSRSHWIEFYWIHLHRCPCGSKHVYWCNLPIKKFAKFLPEMQFNCRLTLVGDRKGLANLVKHALVGLVPNFIALLSWPQF